MYVSTSELEGYKRIQEASRSAERRRKTVVVGDLQPLVAALPSIHEAGTTDVEKTMQRLFSNAHVYYACTCMYMYMYM